MRSSVGFVVIGGGGGSGRGVVVVVVAVEEEKEKWQLSGWGKVEWGFWE